MKLTPALMAAALLGSTAVVAHGQGPADGLLERLVAGGAPDAIALELAGLGEVAQPALIAALPRLARPADVRAVLWALAEHPTARARDVFIRGTRDRRVEVKQAATEHLRLFPGDPAVATTLLRLIDDQDEPTAELALGALMTGAFPVWAPLLDALALELRRSSPRDSRVYPLGESLAALLAVDEQPERRLEEVLGACASIEEPRGRARVFEVVPRSGTAALRPVLVRLLEEACPAPGPAAAAEDDGALDDGFDASPSQAALDDLFAPDGPFESLRPLSDELVSGVVAELGRIAHGPAFGPVLRATRDRSQTLRRSALRAVWPCAATDRERDLALRALAESLAVGDRSIRAVAHGVLQEVTGQRLPLSHAAWSAWLGAQEAARVAAAALAERARDAGYDRVEDYVRDHPQESSHASQD